MSTLEQHLQGMQVGKRRSQQHEFQQVQLKKASKVKKEEPKEGMEAVDLKHHEAPRKSLTPGAQEAERRDSMLTVERAEARTPTELEQYRRASMRVYSALRALLGPNTYHSTPQYILAYIKFCNGKPGLVSNPYGT